MTDSIEVPIGVIVEQPSCFCTLFHICNGCGVVRLTFGEKLNDEYKFRVAVSLPEQQARDLAAALTRLFADTGPHQH
jgi:hypothetical protein